jgi:hypothetical protein
MAGRYDAGEYDMYLFGRTKVMGALVREQIQVGKARLAFEEGFGGHRPHPSKYNTAKFTLLAHGHAFLEYKGAMFGLHYLHSWAQEEDRDGQGCPGPGGVDDSTGYTSTNSVCTHSGARPTAAAPARRLPRGLGGLPSGSSRRRRRQRLAARREPGRDGTRDQVGNRHLRVIYLGYSLVKAKNALTVSPALEVIHANGGGEFGLG